MAGSEEKPRTWMEKHGGSIVIGGVFVVVVLLVVVRSVFN